MTLTLAAKSVAWIAAALAAYLRPEIGDSLFRKLGVAARRAARHRLTTCIAFGLLTLLVRGALLPWWPIPKPAIYDEFSYILQADTFAHGRLANSTHPLWPFFESPYILQHPNYASKYPPGQSLAMAAGQVLLGDPWFGVWLSCGAMAAALVWAMQAWLPPGWVLFGGLLVLPLSINSYWMNSYWGGAVAAIGGAFLLGGYARVVRHNRVRDALGMGIGIAMLANTRPYEGLVFTVPVAIAFLFSRPRWNAIALLAAVLIPAFAATGFYNRAVTGSALQMPFTEYARQYVSIPLFNFQPLQPPKILATPVMDDLHRNWEPGEWKTARSWELIPMRFNDWKYAATTILTSVLTLLPLFLFMPNLWRDRRIRLPLLCLAASLAGSFIEIRYYAHYAAPATAALLIVAVQSFRHLRHSGPAGRFLSRAIPILVLGAALAQIAHPDPEPVNSIRDQVAARLSDLVNRHVILVRYTAARSPHEEWVYNSADIDTQEVIWAHDLGPVQNARLLDYYKDRKIWLFEPDIDPARIVPYQ